MKIKDLTDEQRAEITLIKRQLRVSKVVATRSVKTKSGDFFVGLSAAWDTVQEDAGGMGTCLIDGMDEGEHQAAIVRSGMDLKQAKIAGLILGMKVDLEAWSHALGGGAISDQEFKQVARSIQQKYDSLIAEAIAGKSARSNGGNSE